MVQSFTFLHGNVVSGSMNYFKKTFKTEILHEIFHRHKNMFLHL